MNNIIPQASGSESLCVAILIQAVNDYQDLNNRGLLSRTADGSKYSKSEITRFFNSTWGETLLLSIGGHLTGEYIISLLKTSK